MIKLNENNKGLKFAAWICIRALIITKDTKNSNLLKEKFHIANFEDLKLDDQIVWNSDAALFADLNDTFYGGKVFRDEIEYNSKDIGVINIEDERHLSIGKHFGINPWYAVIFYDHEYEPNAIVILKNILQDLINLCNSGDILRDNEDDHDFLVWNTAKALDCLSLTKEADELRAPRKIVGNFRDLKKGDVFKSCFRWGSGKCEWGIPFMVSGWTEDPFPMFNTDGIYPPETKSPEVSGHQQAGTFYTHLHKRVDKEEVIGWNLCGWKQGEIVE